jgi:hemolysin D
MKRLINSAFVLWGMSSRDPARCTSSSGALPLWILSSSSARRARAKYDRTRLQAPVAGIVQYLAVTTVGQVVNSGQALMTIVPIDTPLEVETMIANKDIGFVRVGQLAVIKVEAFPFTRYGTIGGTVTTISRDAVDNRDSTNLSDATAAVKTPGVAPNSSTSKPELVFPTTINLVQRSMEIDGHEVSLSAGMDVTVEIKTGRRRVINYILSPLWEVVSQTAHER